MTMILSDHPPTSGIERWLLRTVGRKRVHHLPGGAGTVTLLRRCTVAHVRWDLAGHADAERVSAAFAPILSHLFAVHADRLPRRANLRLDATTGALRSVSPELAELVFELVQNAANVEGHEAEVAPPRRGLSVAWGS